MIITEEKVENLPVLMGAGEAAEFFGVTRQALYKWFRGGILPNRKLGGRYVVYRSDIERLIEYRKNVEAREGDTLIGGEPNE